VCGIRLAKADGVDDWRAFQWLLSAAVHCRYIPSLEISKGADPGELWGGTLLLASSPQSCQKCFKVCTILPVNVRNFTGKVPGAPVGNILPSPIFRCVYAPKEDKLALHSERRRI